MPFRIHVNDYILMQKLLSDDGLTWQSFVSAVVEAYLRGDPHVVKAVADWRALAELPKAAMSRALLSHRERDLLLKELESSGSAGKE